MRISDPPQAPRPRLDPDDATPTPVARYFSDDRGLRLQAPCPGFDITVGEGPVVATAIHDGHAIRESLRPHLVLAESIRRREEDPLTSLFTTVGDVRIRALASRFEVDLNRPRDKAVYRRPEDCWGLEVWSGSLPEDEVAASLAIYDRFYRMIAELLDRLVARHGFALLIDLHSYNHRRNGAGAVPAPQADNPDIELGFTTFDPDRWGRLADRFADALRARPMAGRTLDVRANIRFPTGGHFPEWVYANWGDRVCTISPEYKKIHMDEWSAQLDIDATEDLRGGLQQAVDAARGAFPNP